MNTRIDLNSTKRRYLEALSTVFGVSELTTRLNISALLAESEHLATIDHTKHYSGLSAQDLKKIEALGYWFLSGSHQQNRLKFDIGSAVLRILKEEPNSPFFKDLKYWITVWTDGSAGKKFEELVEKTN